MIRHLIDHFEAWRLHRHMMRTLSRLLEHDHAVGGFDTGLGAGEARRPTGR